MTEYIRSLRGGPIPDFSYLAHDGFKKCSKCQQLKPVSEYVKDKKCKDGLLRQCKPCKRKYIKEWRENTPSYNKLHAQKFRTNNPDKRAAHLAIARALWAGTVIKEPCCVCGETKSESHHEDYLKPLDVIWFCRLHHAEHHAKKRRNNE